MRVCAGHRVCCGKLAFSLHDKLNELPELLVMVRDNMLRRAVVHDNISGSVVRPLLALVLSVHRRNELSLVRLARTLWHLRDGQGEAEADVPVGESGIRVILRS